MPYCTECGGAVSASQKFCAVCGAGLQALPQPVPAARLRPNPDAVPQARAVVIEPTPAPLPANTTEAGQEVAFPRSGSTLLADPADPRDAARSTPPGISPLAVVAGILCALALSALVGYWWFAGRRVATPAAVEATEQAVDPPAAQRLPGDVASTAPIVVPQAWTLVTDSTRDTVNGADVLGPPDGKGAVIAPGGSLAVAYQGGQYFYNGEGEDVQIHAPDGEGTRYTMFARDDAAGPWVRFDVNRRGFRNGVAGHDMGHHAMERARQIMIKNDGRSPLVIDALTALHTKPETHDDDHAESPAKPRVRQ